MREAVEIANDAYDILQKHSNEKDVEKICQTVLGDDAEKLRSAKGKEICVASCIT